MPLPETSTEPAANRPGVTEISRCGDEVSCSAYRPPWIANNAVTGTVSTFLALAAAKFTLTDAWSRPLPDAWPRSVIVTGTSDAPDPLVFAPPPSPEVTSGDWAIALTAEILPVTVRLEGSSTVTCSPTLASRCLLGSSSTVTTAFTELVVRTGVDDPPDPPLPSAVGVPRPG